MTNKELRKIVSAHFEGRSLERFIWGLEMDTHNWIELCKEPALRSGLGEEWADRTKYIIGIAVPVIVLIGLEWACSGTLL
jgi:hypothetical protein